MTLQTAADGRGVLSRELSEFLVDFSIALHKHAIYPPGHPALVPAVGRLVERAARLMEDRATLAFGVARHQLVIDGVATDPNQPVLRRLAESLHGHRLGAISLLRGLDAPEMTAALRVLAEEPGPNVTPLGLRPSEQLPDWPHLRLHRVSFDRLQLIGDDPTAPGKTTSRATDLWIGLASAALASDPANLPDGAATEPAAVARAINDTDATAGYDQVIVGYLLQIADELNSDSGADVRALRRRTSGLIAGLGPNTLQRLVTMGGDVAQRTAFVRRASTGMPAESVVKIVEAAAVAGGQPMSRGLTRMLSKLARRATHGDEQVRQQADGALREQVEHLLTRWSPEEPNPDSHVQMLQKLATAAAAASPVGADLVTDHARVEPLRLVQMGLEIGEIGVLGKQAVDRAVAGGSLRSVRLLLDSAPPGSRAAAQDVLSRLIRPRTIAAIAMREPLDLESLDALLPLVTSEGYAALLDVLMTSENRTTRRKLLERLVQARVDIRPLLVKGLDDARWYVTRNLLLLLERLPPLPAGFSPARWTRHADSRVRHQAIHLQLMIPDEWEAAVTTALADADWRVVRLGLVAVQQHCPRQMVPAATRIAASPHAEEEVRVLAVRALARSRDPETLATLLRLVDGGKTLLGRPKLAPTTPVVVAAIRTLAGAWSGDARAAVMLGLASSSSDPELRNAARQRPA